MKKSRTGANLRPKLRRGVRHVRHHSWHMVKSILFGFLFVFFLSGLGAVGTVLYYYATLPNYHTLENHTAPESSKIYSRDGTLLYEFHGEVKRTRVPLNTITPNLKLATIAIEDRDFYNHGAVSLWGIARTIVSNYKAGGITQGGSTITQQFVKNALLTNQRSYGRKLSEILLSYQIEAHYSKDQILEMYLNEIPYGRNAYGAEAAAQTYFGKSAHDLTLAESAYLAALPQAPSYYNPTGLHIDELEARKDKVLTNMLDQRYISKDQYNAARDEKVEFYQVKTSIIAPYFVTWVQNILQDKYGDQFLREGGLKVYTSLDLNLQALAEQAVKDGAVANIKKNNAYNAALVAVEPSSGKILAMVGGKDYFGVPEPKGCKPGSNCKFEPNVNVAVSDRQPGSSFKPYAYVTAFTEPYGYGPSSMILDSPTSFGTANGRAYVPQDYDGGARGLITIRKALAGSLNIPAVRILAAVGVKNVINTAKGLGISSPLQNCGLSLVLGGCEVKLVDHTAAFAALSNMGKFNGNTPFLRIEDKNGTVLEQYKAQNRQVVAPEAVYQLISIMTDDKSRQYIFGPKNPLNLPDRPVACKTGTTQNWKDGWTMCFTPQLAVGVWTGNNDGTLMRQGADGVFTAAPIWQSFMIKAMAGQPVIDWPVPEGIVQINVDPNSGKPLGSGAKGGRLDPFAWYALPAAFKVPAAPRSVINRLAPLPPVIIKKTIVPTETSPVAPDPTQPPSATPVPQSVQNPNALVTQP